MVAIVQDSGLVCSSVCNIHTKYLPLRSEACSLQAQKNKVLHQMELYYISYEHWHVRQRSSHLIDCTDARIFQTRSAVHR